MSSQDADLSCHNFHRTQSNWYILPLSAESPHISHRTLEINKEQIIYGKYTLCWIIVSAMHWGGGLPSKMQRQITIYVKQCVYMYWGMVHLFNVAVLRLIYNEQGNVVTKIPKLESTWSLKAILLCSSPSLRGLTSVEEFSSVVCLCFNRGKRGPWQADLRQALRRTPTPTSSDTVVTLAFLFSLLFLWQTAGIPLLDCSLTITFIIWAHYKSLG